METFNVYLLLLVIVIPGTKGENIAIGKPTQQSSTYPGGDSSKAVDGDTDSNYDSGSCTHTYSSQTEWWCVDLQAVYNNISYILLYNRATNTKRLQGFTLKTSRNGECNVAGFTSATTCYIDTSSSVEDIYTVDTCNQQSSSLSDTRVIFISVSNNPLTLCEVEVLTDCSKCKDDVCENRECKNGCMSGFIGPKCLPCNYICNNGCDQQNSICNNGCKEGRYGDQCDMTCSYNCNNGCDLTTGRCNNCKVGLYGDQCDMTCNNNCNDGGCERATGKCNNGCKQGRYGDRCDKPCNINCYNGCDRITGRCSSCKVGWYGDKCTTPCNKNCNNGCEPTNGKCIGGCKGKFYGDKCDMECTTCQTSCQQSDGVCNNGGCVAGYWGAKCLTSCSSNCVSGQCGKGDGRCTSCPDGKYGIHCEQTCNNGCIDKDCDRDGGRCSKDCTRGKYSDQCNTDCVVTNCVGNCDRTSGQCKTCTTGWYGKNCEMGCPVNCYGKECRKSDGRCSKGCTRGRYSDHCNTDCTVTNCVGNCDRTSGQCNTCTTGWYGNNCESKCSSKCSSGCDQSTGRCDYCIEGRFGDGCDKLCPPNCVGGCNRIDGKCNSCKPDKVGDYCNTTCNPGCQTIQNKPTCDRNGRCTQCVDGKYGVECDQNCTNTCKDGCHRDNGSCIHGCIKGKSGDYCNTNCNNYCTVCKQHDNNTCDECKDGRWDRSCDQLCNTNCKPAPSTTVGVCDISNGRCDEGCKTGWYDEYCNTSCSESCKHSVCEQKTGNCTDGCIDGKMGFNCSDDCVAGYYGVDCNSTCGNCAQNTSCGVVTGSCGLVGCMEGYTGPTCHELSPDDNTVIIVVIVFAGVALIILILIVSCFLYRRKKKKDITYGLGNGSGRNREDRRYVSFSKTSPNMAEDTERSEDEINSRSGLYVNTSPTLNTDSVYQNDKPLSADDIYQNDKQLTNGDVYENVGPHISPTRIALTELFETIQSKNAKDTFETEYADLPQGLCMPYGECMNTVNRPKNRYKNICAFDHSRVKLEIENDDPTTDYINACYITGFGKTKKRYIASQGPNDVNINDFVRMLWDAHPSKIVMLTNLEESGVIKCLRYWPLGKKSKQFGKITVRLMGTEELAHFTTRTLKLEKESEKPKIIKHYHFTSWPDKKVPTDLASLVEFRNKVKKSQSKDQDILLAHCSAGIGRTGTFLALDYLLEEAEADGSVDVFECVKQMRYERVNMVQTQDQYKFIHDAILEWYVGGQTTTTVTAYQDVYQDLLKVNKKTQKEVLKEKFVMMNKIRPQYTDEEDYRSALLKENKSKNRDQTILPFEQDRPLLVLDVPGTNDYINAVYLSSYKRKKAYILTQTPQPHTVIDFWRMIIQTGSNTVVYVDFGQKKTKDIGDYIPNENSLTCGSYVIRKIDEILHSSGFYKIVTIQITNLKDNDMEQIVRIYKCLFWRGVEETPQSSNPIFNLLENIQSWIMDQENGRQSIIVHCRNGVDKSGLFCVLAAILERLTVEQDVSVLQTILQLRASRPQIITSYNQLKFCFDAVGNYLDNFSTYANSC